MDFFGGNRLVANAIGVLPKKILKKLSGKFGNQRLKSLYLHPLPETVAQKVLKIVLKNFLRKVWRIGNSLYLCGPLRPFCGRAERRSERNRFFEVM